jgi:hypothetical protein
VGISPFDLFNDFGNAIDGNKIRLCDYAEKLYNFFADKCNKEILREKILCDLLSCSSSVQIPEIVKRKDTLYKKIKKYFIEIRVEKPCARDPRSPVPLTLAVQNSLTL